VFQTFPQYALLAFGILCANSVILSFFAGVSPDSLFCQAADRACTVYYQFFGTVAGYFQAESFRFQREG
jgi:hypothetical protein